jgi:lysophospholipid acyltransferase (LPLAT)-like uncharacterized protein
MFKEIKYALMLNLLPPVVYLFLVLLRATVKIEHANREAVDRLWQKGENIIACFWHGRLLAMPFAYKGNKGKVLISRHRDGEFIARVISYFGVGTVRGSYRKEGSVSSVREMLSEIGQGTDLGITPDGPKGPRYQVKQGIIELARLTGRPIVPVTYSASKKKVFSSWDRFVLPYPFSKILFVWGDPLFVARDARGASLEQRRLDLEEGLVALTEKADRMVCGD